MDVLTFKRIKSLIDTSRLLENTPIKQDASTIKTYNFSKEVLLITGAAGSIGRGLTQQLMHSKFKHLLVLDNAETPLFHLKATIPLEKKDAVTCILADIRDKTTLNAVFSTYTPTIVFHTAAYKHVALAEDFPLEAIKTNVFGTIHLAEMAIKHSVKKFISISTDKAAEPVGVMGMTKLIAEKYLDNLSNPITKFVSARFGNIFGSNGSVATLFVKQLNDGVPLTVTHPTATRLFIDKAKACHLILGLATHNKLDYNKVSFEMGAPIKIIDLAKGFIEVYNTRNNTSIKSQDIEITALTSGEKIHETLIAKNESLLPSCYTDIYYIKSHAAKTSLNVEMLVTLVAQNSTKNAKTVLASLIEN